MKKFVLSFFLFGIFLGLASCEDNEGLDVTDIEIPEGYALSAGTSTVFLNSSYAFDKDADWISEISANQKRFTHGDRLYDDVHAIATQDVPNLLCGHKSGQKERALPSMVLENTDSAVCWFM